MVFRRENLTKLAKFFLSFQNLLYVKKSGNQYDIPLF